LNPRRAADSTALVWFRRDLRLADQPALTAVLASGAKVIPCYIDAPEEEAPWSPGAATRWWLHGALESLDAELRARGSRLVIRKGPTSAALAQLIDETGASAVYWNRLYEPALIARDQSIKAELKASGVEVQTCNAAMLLEPWQLATQAHTPFRVFTPFWRRLSARLDQVPPCSATPTALPLVPATLKTLQVADLGLLPKIPWTHGMSKAWDTSEHGAQQALARLRDEAVAAYALERDQPGREGTSRLSPYLHFGQIGPRQILHELRGSQAADKRIPAGAADTFLRQIGWRDFAHYLLFHFPETPEQPFQPMFRGLPVRQDSAALKHWQRGRTGVPLVDAGMRELWETGWMHNRVRMVVASFLTKNLGIHWLEGARWFWETLVDADLANNTMGWQWSAGCGADAAPYYRIFNPVAQTERFDPEGKYLRRWLPELARLPDRWIARPWQAPPEVLRAAGVELGKSYRKPLVDLTVSREQALANYQTLRASTALP
jgi:deoxyribodipyrimidine photo-lyase